MSYDIIGDIHGQADKLEVLFRKMGYTERNGCWSHPGRTAVFVGDFVDRGPAQLRAVTMVRRMVEEGKALAVMGNHEFNAIAWHTPNPETPGDYLRPRFSERWGDKNRQQHARFLEEVEQDAALHADLIGWFKTLPLFLDIPGIRVVHACWHSPFMDWLSPQLKEGKYLDDSLLAPATREPEDESEKDNATPSIFKAVEVLTKGIEIPLPEGHSFLDKDKFQRTRVRVRWWNGEGQTYRQAAMLDDEGRNRLPDVPIPAYACAAAPTDKHIFFGHYWMTGDRKVLSENATCVDYSAGKDGPLVAYRWDGESRLSDRNLLETE